MARVTRDRLADADLVEIAEYIGQRSGSPDAARRFLDNLHQKLDVYATQPEMGQLHPDLGEGVRLFSFGNYVIVYRPIEDGIDVLRVFEGHRDYPSLFRPKP